MKARFYLREKRLPLAPSKTNARMRFMSAQRINDDAAPLTIQRPNLHESVLPCMGNEGPKAGITKEAFSGGRGMERKARLAVLFVFTLDRPIFTLYESHIAPKPN